MDEGILYVATGVRYLEEAAQNARAGRSHVGGRPIAVMTDDVEAARELGCFDLCLPHPDPRRSYRDKIPPLIDPPFERTLFLDTDARIIAAVDELFAMVEYQDLLAAHAPVRCPSGWGDRTVPGNFSELNSGVLVLRRGARQKALVSRWLELYDEVGQDWDQATLRSACWSHLPNGLRIGILPPEANLRTTKPWVAGKGLSVTILHGRVPSEEWAPLVEYLNGDTDRFRTYDEWQRTRPETQVTTRVASSRRTRPASTQEMHRVLAEVSARSPEPMDDPLLCEDPVFILSAGGRSGSTLLQRMLVNDPGIMIWGEPHDRARIIQSLCDQWRPFGANWPKSDHLAPPEPDAGPDDSWLANRSPAIDDLRQAHRRFLDRVFGEPARAAGRMRWGLKEVRLDAGHVTYLRWLYPGARFLLLVRNPFDAYLSSRRHGPCHFDWPEPPVQKPTAFGRIWSRLATDFHDLASNSACTLLHHERLADSIPLIMSGSALTRIASPQDLKTLRGNAVADGPDRLGTLERSRLARATKSARSLLGY